MKTMLCMSAVIKFTHSLYFSKSFEELTVFENTIKAVISAIDLTNTLVIVTADHSHSFELTGQQSRFLSLFLPDIGKGPEVSLSIRYI